MAISDDARDGRVQTPDPEESCRESLRSDEMKGVLSSSQEQEREPCCDILHGLNNALVSILLNAQVIEWKLPSYSRLKRNVHEVERSAQRGGLLVQRLRNWLEMGAAGDSSHLERGAPCMAVDNSRDGAGHPRVVDGGKAVGSDNAAGIVRGG